MSNNHQKNKTLPTGFLLICCLALALYSSCGAENTEQHSEKPLVFVDEKPFEINYARGFVLQKEENQWQLVVRNPQDTQVVFGNYWLSSFEEAHNAPGEFALNLPIQSVACQSTTQIPFFSNLGQTDKIKGVAHAAFVRDSAILGQLEEGTTIDLTGANDLDFEKTLQLNPQLLLVYPFQEQSLQKFERTSIQLLYVTEYLERHPLARAEWIKVFGLLTGQQEKANREFQAIEKRYLALKKRAAEFTARPSVFFGSQFKGIWHAPSGSSLMGHLINDAGAKYIFGEEHTVGNIQVDFEILLEKALKVDYWGKLESSTSDLTLAQILAEDDRYRYFKAFEEKQIFYCNTQKVDYFGQGILEPDAMLADLISIFHFPEKKQPTSYFRLLIE